LNQYFPISSLSSDILQLLILCQLSPFFPKYLFWYSHSSFSSESLYFSQNIHPNVEQYTCLHYSHTLETL
ncbi:hypothetical protein PFISCL1PPCAC_7165, partial [Pristionchus fissidentatus]